MRRQITLIKLGGAIITDKEKPMTLRAEVLARLVTEIAEAKKVLPDQLFIVGHGAGSFAHVPAKQYQTMSGFINDDSRYGMAIVQDTAAQLNRIVVKQFLASHQPAVTLAPSNTILTNQRVAAKFCSDICQEYLQQGLLPITYGDVLADQAQGCTVWSTEEVLAFLATELEKKDWQIKQIIHVTEVAGFYNQTQQVVPEITSENWPSLRSSLAVTKGVDVTGGMGLKVEESLKLAAQGIPSKIISGLLPNRLYHALVGEETVGTVIRQ